MLSELLYSKNYPVYTVSSGNIYLDFDIDSDIINFWRAASEAQKYPSSANPPLYTVALSKYFIPSPSPLLKQEEPESLSRNTGGESEKRFSDSLQTHWEISEDPAGATNRKPHDTPRKNVKLPELTLPAKEGSPRTGMFDSVTPKEFFLGTGDSRGLKPGRIGGGKDRASTAGSAASRISTSTRATSNYHSAEIEVTFFRNHPYYFRSRNLCPLRLRLRSLQTLLLPQSPVPLKYIFARWMSHTSKIPEMS